MCTVLNVKDVGYNYPNAVYVGRPSDFGNPFSVEVFGRKVAIEKFAALVERDEEFKNYIKQHLKGKNLLCWCSPLPCHADVLMRIANE